MRRNIEALTHEVAETSKAAVDESRLAAERMAQAAEGALVGVREGARERMHEAGEAVHRLRTAVRDRYDRTVEAAEHGYRRAKKSIAEAGAEGRAYARDHIGLTAAVAASGAFLLGLWLGHRRRDRR
jgi:hypothetical protein